MAEVMGWAERCGVALMPGAAMLNLSWWLEADRDEETAEWAASVGYPWLWPDPDRPRTPVESFRRVGRLFAHDPTDDLTQPVPGDGPLLPTDDAQ